MVEQVLDVGLRGRRVGLVEFPVGVGGTDDPVPSPRDDEQHAALGAEDEPGVRADTVPRNDQVHALGRADVQLSPAADEVLDVVGPHARRVDHLLGAYRPFGAGLEVANADTGDPLALAQEPDDLSAVGHVGAVGGRRANDRHGVPGVVDLRVVVLDATDQRVGLERGNEPQRLATGQMTVPWQPAAVARRDRHRVVEREPGADVRAFPEPPVERIQERHRADQVRRESLNEQSSLTQGLAHEPEVEHLEVTQAAVDELRRPGRRARRPVPHLHERRRETTRDGVQRAAGSDDAPADDDHVVLGGVHPRHRGCSLLPGQPGGLHARLSSITHAGRSATHATLATGSTAVTARAVPPHPR